MSRLYAGYHGYSAMADNGNRSVIWKLISFTFAMITLPIGTYFFTVNFVFKGKLFMRGLELALTLPRQRNMGGWFGSTHGERGLDCICNHGIQR